MGISVNDVSGIGAVSNLVQDVVDKVWPDKIAQAKERSDFLLQVQTLDNQLAQGQMAINQQEASNNNIFVSGWRPFIGWVCGSAFGYHLILQPLASFIMAANGHSFPLPSFDTATLNTVLMGLLGLGGMRSLEKIKGVA